VVVIIEDSSPLPNLTLDFRPTIAPPLIKMSMTNDLVLKRSELIWLTCLTASRSWLQSRGFRYGIT
jgi:hypothetical protein